VWKKYVKKHITIYKTNYYHPTYQLRIKSKDHPGGKIYPGLGKIPQKSI